MSNNMSLAEFQALRHEKLGYPDVEIPTPRAWDELEKGYTPVEHNTPFLERKLLSWKRPELDAAWERTKRLSVAQRIARDPVSLRPLNPSGATGISGFGRLRELGPNLTSDGLVTIGTKVLIIERGDTGQLAFPGGFREELPDGSYEEEVKAALREVKEETGLRIKGEYDITRISIGATALSLRNTDNAWVENAAYHIDIPGNGDALPPVNGDDDAKSASWYDLDSLDLSLMSDTHAANAQLLQESILG